MLAAAPPPTIVPGRGIAGVVLHDAVSEVERVLGRPLRTSATELRYRTIDVRLAHGRVVRISTTSARYRTRDGFGVGTRVERLQSLRGIFCNLVPGGGDCVARGIRFDFARDRVTRVTVA